MAKKKQSARSAATEPNRPYNLAGRQADILGWMIGCLSECLR